MVDKLREEAKERQRQAADSTNAKLGRGETLSPDLGKPNKVYVAKELAEKAGIGRSSMESLMSVQRNAPDLFNKVKSGEITINKAYKEKKKREIVGQAYTDLGRELKEAQERLAKHGYGCFREWCVSVGFKKDTVSRMMQRYDLIVANCDERELLEDLPVSLTYEIAKPSAEPKLKQKVNTC